MMVRLAHRRRGGFARPSAAAWTLAAALALSGGPSFGMDVHVEASGPIGAAYVGLLYGLADPADGSWYVGSDWGLEPSTSWTAIVDTGASACVLGMTTQDLYTLWDGVGLPMELYPDVRWLDEGFGGTAEFKVTQPMTLMVADFALMEGDTEDHSQYTAYGPVGGPQPPSIRLAAALEPIGGGLLDTDILGMSLLQGRLLHVSPREFEWLRIGFGMYGSLNQPAPSPDNPRAVYLPVTMQGFFQDPQPVDVGEHPMLPVYMRRDGDDPMAARLAFFDSGSPVNFVSEGFAVDAGIDLASEPDLTVTVAGVGSGQSERPGWYVDSLALDMAPPRADQLVFSNTAVFVIPDEYMPGGLEAILGNGLFGPGVDSVAGTMIYDSPFPEWYVDTRDPDSARLIIMLDGLATVVGDANLDGIVGIADLVALADNYGLDVGATWTQGDVNEDGQVGIADLVALADNYGAGGAQAPAVPEPAAAAFLAGGLALIRRRRR